MLFLYVRIGDVGYYTEDGYFFVVDRIKEMIKCMDQQVAPAELENILFVHDDVKEVAVVGVPHAEYGEAARAFVVPFEHVQRNEVTILRLRKLVEGDELLFLHLLLCAREGVLKRGGGGSKALVLLNVSTCLLYCKSSKERSELLSYIEHPSKMKVE